MRTSLKSNSGDLPSFVREQMASAVLSHSQFGNLSDSEEFMAQLLERVSECDYLEIHGGEPFIDKQLWSFLDQVSRTRHARRLKLRNLSSTRRLSIEFANKTHLRCFLT